MNRFTGLMGAVAIALVASTAVAETVTPDKVMITDGAIAASLTGAAGNPEEGAKAMVNRGLGNCLACHVVSNLKKELFHGDVGPALDGVADRWSVEELRAIVVNSKKSLSEETLMPGFYSLDVGKNVVKDRAGQTILTAEQVEDIVAYLATLKE